MVMCVCVCADVVCKDVCCVDKTNFKREKTKCKDEGKLKDPMGDKSGLTAVATRRHWRGGVCQMFGGLLLIGEFV